MKGVNLEKELQTQRTRLRAENEVEILAAFKKLYQAEADAEQKILANIFGGEGSINELDVSLLDPNRIFGVDEIKKICVDYRLRFLDGSYFKGDIPFEALSKIKALQKDQKTELTGYKIIAPAPMFNLEEKDKDPLLFVNLGNGLYYLIHKWGSDLKPWRKVVVYPFRRFESLFKTIIAFAFVIAAAVPSEIMMGPKDTTSMHIRVIFFFYLFLAFSGLTALYGFSRMKNFSVALWKSKYFD